jgi:YidC/Oxa1 family membrane protein insertase
MDQQKRMFLALGLSFGLIFVYTMYFGPKPAPTDSAATAAAQDGGALAQAPAPTAPETAVPGADAGTGVAAALPPVVTLNRDDALVHRSFSSEGGGFTRVELQGPKMRETQKVSLVEGYKRFLGKGHDDAPQMDMGRPIAGAPLPLAVSIEGPQPLPHNARYSVDESGGHRAVNFAAQVNGWEVTKHLEWDEGSYEYLYKVTLKNTGAAPVTGEMAVHYGLFVDFKNEEAPNFFGGVGNQSRSVCYVADEHHKQVDPPKEKENISGPVSFWGIDQQYFLAALYPVDGSKPGRCVLNVLPEGRTATVYFPLSVAPGQSATYQLGAYVGPKDVDYLAAAPTKVPEGMTRVPAQLERSVDFGIWAVICKLLLAVLKFFYGIIHNWGVAIILLTVAVKVVLLPLTHKSMVSAEQMKKLQPKMEEIKKKYPEDRERQSMETMKLYQQEKVNPLGGCLPMLVQMPVWIALFTTLRASYEIYREPFISPLLMDLTYKDPTYLLPILLGVTMVITQKMQPQMMDAAQARMMTWIMPVFFTAIMLNYPSGLSLYIFTNNLLTIVQQKGLRKYLDSRPAAGKAQTPEAKRRLT